MDDKSPKDGVPKTENKRNPGRPKGLPKSGGRAPGSPNKKTLSFAQELDAHGFNIAGNIAALYKTTKDINTKIRLIELAAKYRLAIPTAQDEPVVSYQQGPQQPSDILKIVNDK